MKLKFKKQQFQIDAANAAEIIKGQMLMFSVDRCFTGTNAMTNGNETIKRAEQEMRLF